MVSSGVSMVMAPSPTALGVAAELGAPAEQQPPGAHRGVPALPAPKVSARISPPSMVSSGVSMVIWPPAPSPEVPLNSTLSHLLPLPLMAMASLAVTISSPPAFAPWVLLSIWLPPVSSSRPVRTDFPAGSCS